VNLAGSLIYKLLELILNRYYSALELINIFN